MHCCRHSAVLHDHHHFEWVLGLSSHFVSLKKNCIWNVPWTLGMIYEICLMNLLLTDFLFIWIPTVVEAITDDTGNTSSWMKTQDFAKDKPWDLEQIYLSTIINIVCLHPKMFRTFIICPPQCASYLIFVKFPRVYGAISNSLFYLILLITLGRVRTGMRKANL